jgi:hypothetical protein
MMTKNAMSAFVLLFALQAIVGPALCAVHVETSTPTGISDGVSPARPTQVDEPALTPQLDGLVSDQSRHEDNGLDHCDEAVLLVADARLPTPGSFSIVFDMAPAWQHATLQPLSSGSALPPRWARLAWPPPQSSPLEIAPRLRI